VGRRFIQYSVLEKDQSFSVGDEFYGYTVEKVVPVTELSLTAIHLQHRSGAQHLHISRQDNNNVFGFVIALILKMFGFVKTRFAISNDTGLKQLNLNVCSYAWISLMW